jgi:hypothetical protein
MVSLVDALGHHHAAHEPDDHGQNYEPDDQNCRAAGDQVDLDDLQHQLGVVDDCLLQKALPDGQFARHDLCEDDDQNQGFRRVAWHIDAIAKTTNKDSCCEI